MKLKEADLRTEVKEEKRKVCKEKRGGMFGSQRGEEGGLLRGEGLRQCEGWAGSLGSALGCGLQAGPASSGCHWPGLLPQCHLLPGMPRNHFSNSISVFAATLCWGYVGLRADGLTDAVAVMMEMMG